MTTWQAMNALEEMGYQFTATDGGVRATLYGKPPGNASALLDIVRLDRDGARAYVQERQEGTMVIDDGCTYSLFDALAIGQAVRRGDAKLLGKVIVHQKDMTATVRWAPVRGDLAECRERFKTLLQSRLQAAEAEFWDSSTLDVAEALLSKIERYTMILALSTNG